MDKQRTIQNEISVSGTGLHTAKKSSLTLKPADIDSGIIFTRIDLADRPKVRALPENVLTQTRSLRRSSIGKDNVEIHTIEHLMAAISGLGIDNLNVEIDNEEVPGLDGSSINFVELILKGGIKEQERERSYYTVTKPISVEEGQASISALPYDGFKVSYTLDYNHPMLRSQFKEVEITPDSFKSDISQARTFCLEEEVKKLQEQGVGLGANYENTLVLGKTGVINNKLRYSDEFLRHKILDLIGDLYLLGRPIKAHIVALKSGHSLNLELIKMIQKQSNPLSALGIDDYCPTNPISLNIEQIMDILPHREPFLFVDRIIAMEFCKRAIGIKNVTINDYFFKGHFPGKPVMPGVLIIEAMGQVGGIMMLACEENRGKLAYFMAFNNVKFRRVVVPGDQLVFDVVAGKIKSKTGQVFGRALVDGKVVAEAELMFALAER